MEKVAAMEEMHLIYQVLSDYLAGREIPEDVTLLEVIASYRSLCVRQPIAGMFLESVIEELLDRAMDE